MIRYTFKKVNGNHIAGCFYCDENPLGFITDRKNGEEYWACSEHIKKGGNIQRRQLHPDFKKESKRKSILHIKKHRDGIQTYLLEINNG